MRLKHDDPVRRFVFSYPLLLLAVWTGILLAGNWVVLQTSLLQWNTAGYVSTTGEIMRSELVKGAFSHRGVTLSYSYAVNGLGYTGRRYRFDDRDGAFDYRAVTNAYRPGSRQKIYYDAANPGVSVLSRGLSGCDLLLMIFALPLDIATAALWKTISCSKGAVVTEKRVGAARILRRENETRVRLADVSPLAAGFFVMGFAGFISSMVVVFANGFSPSLHLMCAVWIEVAASGLIGFLWMLQRCEFGHYDLRISKRDATVTVPAICGRGEPVTLSHKEIEGISIEKRTLENPSGEYTTYVTTLNCRAPDGKSDALALCNWGWTEPQAKALGLWLSEELRVPLQEKAGVSKRSSVAATR